MDAEHKAVMMAWEGPLMEAHAHVVCAGGGSVLNIGFGLGLIDEVGCQTVTLSALDVRLHCSLN